MQRYIFSNGAETLELHYVSAVEGLGIPPVDIISTKGYKQDGVTVRNADYQPRVFSLSFGIAGKNYLAATEERRAITRFFADKLPKSFSYQRDNFSAYLYPVYLTGGYDTGIKKSRLIPGVMQFIAANPYFKRDIPHSSVMLEVPLFEYPEAGLEWPADGLEFSTAEERLEVYNTGDIGADAVVRFVGPAITPYVENTTTSQRIEADRTLDAGDVLEINSATGRVDIIDALGDRHNAFNYITDTSEFITLAPGVNNIAFGSAGGALGYVEVGGTEYYAGF